MNNQSISQATITTTTTTHTHTQKGEREREKKNWHPQNTDAGPPSGSGG